MPVELLAAVLQRVQAERGHGGGVGHLPDAEDAAFLVELVVREDAGRIVLGRGRSSGRGTYRHAANGGPSNSPDP